MEYAKTVSVVLPTFNRAWIVREAIDSVLGQTYKDFELIVVDDGSTDETESVLAEYGGQIRVIRQENRGVSAARNAGIVNASGKLIALLDSDDLWIPKKLEMQVDFFRRNPEALICQTQEIWIRNGKRVNPRKRHKKLSGMIFEPSLSLCLVSPSAVMFDKILIDDVGFFDETLPACEDYDLWLRVGLKYPVFLIDENLTVKRGGHADQLSRNAMLDKYRIQSIEKLLDREPMTKSQRRAAVIKLKEKCGIYSSGCLKRGRIKEAERYLELAERYGAWLNNGC
jgi:glycosyltransferase involved in cell wall biosynthesis